jgi:transposase
MIKASEMPAPLSDDLRIRAVAAYRAGGQTYEDVAGLFRVGVASINRWLRLDRERGTTTPRAHGDGRSRQIDD